MAKFGSVLLLFIMISGCIQEVDDLEFATLNPGVAFPIGYISINASSLTKIGDSLDIREGEDNVIEFFYEEEIQRIALTDRFSINDQSFGDNLPFNAFVFIAGQSNEVQAYQHSSFTLSNIDNTGQSPDLTKIIFKSGGINVTQGKDFDHSVVTTISLPKLTKNGTPYSVVVTDQETASEPLEGYELDLTGTGGNEANVIEYEISTTISNTGSSSSGTLSFTLGLASIKFNYLEGDFHTYVFDQVEQKTDLNLPESEIPDNIGFTNPSIGLIVDNSTGISFGIDINEFSFTDTEGQKQFVTGTYDDATSIIEMAVVPGDSVQSIFNISNQNTDNLIDLISDIPKSAFISAAISANPFPSVTPNFITDTSEVVVNVNLVIPLEGYADNYAFIDTLNDLSLDFDDQGVISLDEISLQLQVENNFPFELGLQLYFMDSIPGQPILDSLFSTIEEQQLIPSAIVDATGLVQSSEVASRAISISGEKYERVKGAKSIRLAVYLLTPGADENPRKSVKFTTDNYLSIRLGLTADALIDLNKIN